jgi:hypothetical protein
VFDIFPPTLNYQLLSRKSKINDEFIGKKFSWDFLFDGREKFAEWVVWRLADVEGMAQQKQKRGNKPFVEKQ